MMETESEMCDEPREIFVPQREFILGSESEITTIPLLLIGPHSALEQVSTTYFSPNVSAVYEFSLQTVFIFVRFGNRKSLVTPNRNL